MLRFRQLARVAGFDPDGLKACAGIGRYWQLHRIEHGEPQADGYIVGEITIELARLMVDCRPGRVLLAIGHQGRCLDRLAGAVIDANRLLREHTADLGRRLEARLAVGNATAGALQPAVRTIRAKHGWVYRAVDLVWAPIGAPSPRPASA